MSKKRMSSYQTKVTKGHERPGDGQSFVITGGASPKRTTVVSRQTDPDRPPEGQKRAKNFRPLLAL
jgi:hypothetical protein